MAKSVNINGEQLKRLITMKGTNMQEMGLAVGYSKSYISNACALNRIAEPVVLLIEKLYEIDRGLYVIPEEEKPKQLPAEAEVVKVEPIDYQKLFAVIYQAFKKALSE